MYVKQAGELYRLLGDEVRLRLLRVLAGKHGRLNVTELTAVLGIAQSGVSRHLRLLEGSRARRRRTRRRLFLLSPLPCPARWRVRRAVAGAAGAVRRGGAHAGRARRRSAAAGSDPAAQGELRSPRHRPRAVRAGPKLGGLVARARPAAAAGRCRRHRLRRRILVCRIGAVGQARRRHRSIGRRAEAREGARRTARREEHHLEARRHGEAAARGRDRSTWRCSRRRCTMRRIPRAPSPKRRAFSGRAAACSCSICANTIKNGCAIASAIAGSASRMSELERFLTGAGLTRRERSASDRGLPGDPFTVLIASGVNRLNARSD